MMSIDLSDQMPPSRRSSQTPPRRPTPCAGLFGWRKEPLPGDPHPDQGKDDKAPGRDYPAG